MKITGSQQIRIDTYIENFAESAKSESRSENATIKLTASQKIVLGQMAAEESRTISSLGSDLIEIGIHFYQHRDKFRKHGELINLILRELS